VLFVIAFTELDAVPERLGLGAWLVAFGSMVLATGLFYDDEWGLAHPEASPLSSAGPRPTR